MNINDIVKLKNPSFPFQSSLRYRVVKLLKTSCHVIEVHDKTLYKGVKYSLLEVIKQDNKITLKNY